MFLGMPHAFKAFGDKLSEGKRWDRTIFNGIKWALSKPAPGEFIIQTE